MINTRELRHSITNPGDDSRFLEYDSNFVEYKNLELLGNDLISTYFQYSELDYPPTKPIYANDFNFALLIIFITHFLNQR